MKYPNLVFIFVMLFVFNVSIASAGDLTIKVSKRNAAGGATGDLANVTVCVFNASTFEQLTTASNGKAIFQDFPAGSYTATATKSGFVGQSLQFSFSGSNTTQFMTLPEGTGGAICSPPPPKPDLVVHMVQSPANPVTTEDTVTYGIGFSTNIATGTVKVRFKFATGFDMRDGGIESTTGVTCTGAGLEVNCTTARLSSVTKTITIRGQYPNLGGLAQKQFLVSVNIDPENAIAETNESNNSVSLTTTVNAKPDLVPDLSGSDAQAVLGSPFAYSVKVKNIGKAPAGASRMNIQLPSQATFSHFENMTFSNCQAFGSTGKNFFCDAGGLPVGGSASVKVVAIANTLFGGPIMNFTATADAAQAVDESDNANNILEITTTLDDPRRPDLSVISPRSSPWSCDAHPIPGELFIFPFPSLPCCDGITLTSTIKNDGEVESGQADLTITFDRNKLENLCVSGSNFDSASCVCVKTGCTTTSSGITCPIPSIIAGGTLTLPIDLREFNRLDGHYNIVFKIDSGNDVEEEDESNNETNFTAD